MESFNVTVERYRSLLGAEKSRQTQPADVNLDVGKPTTAGMYKSADETYAELVDRLAKDGFAGVSQDLRNDILSFYKDEAAATSREDNEDKRAKLRHQLETLRGSTAYSKP
jgi:hypothetical protein